MTISGVGRSLWDEDKKGKGKGDLDGRGYLHFLFFEAGLVGLDYGEG
jgi:hypothetical protein